MLVVLCLNFLPMVLQVQVSVRANQVERRGSCRTACSSSCGSVSAAAATAASPSSGALACVNFFLRSARPMMMMVVQSRQANE